MRSQHTTARDANDYKPDETLENRRDTTCADGPSPYACSAPCPPSVWRYALSSARAGGRPSAAQPFLPRKQRRGRGVSGPRYLRRWRLDSRNRLSRTKQVYPAFRLLRRRSWLGSGVGHRTDSPSPPACLTAAGLGGVHRPALRGLPFAQAGGYLDQRALSRPISTLDVFPHVAHVRSASRGQVIPNARAPAF